MNTTATEHSRTRIGIVDLIAQAVLALAVALAISITIAGAVLLLAGAA